MAAPRWPAGPGRRAGSVLVSASAAAVVLLVGLPRAALVARSLPAGLVGQYLGGATVVAALRLSLLTTAATLLVSVAVGTPVAYVLARREFPGKQLLDTLIDLPMVLPPAVAGVALL